MLCMMDIDWFVQESPGFNPGWVNDLKSLPVVNMFLHNNYRMNFPEKKKILIKLPTIFQFKLQNFHLENSSSAKHKLE